MNEDKTLGLDHLLMAFWCFNWDFVKVDVLKIFKEFHEQGRFIRSLNANFLVSIPKKKGVDDLKILGL